MTKQRTRDVILWLSFIAGPAFWLFSFQAKLSWTQWACVSRTKATLFVFAGIALLLSAAAAFLGWQQWTELGAKQPDETADVPTRSRFMALSAMVFGISFCLVIVAQAVPDLILGACQ